MDLELDLPETQTQEDYIEGTQELEAEVENTLRPWGRFCACMSTLVSVDLFHSSYTFGRAPSCDIVVGSQFTAHLNISKQHFRVIKENEMVYIIDLSKNGTFVNGSKIGRNQKLIIHNNDEIAVGQPNVKVYMFNCNINYDNAPPEVRRKYFISKVLGQGAFGEVRLALDKRTFEQYAIKKITKGRSSTRVIGQASHPQKIKTEVEILKSLSHPFIIKMREVFETDDSVFLILEYMKGGELTGRILSATPFPESEVKFIFYQIMLGVRYLHANGVTHRDLKPENVLLHSDGSYPLAKISDFGLSKIMENISAMETTCGTIAYVAPEVLNHLKRYNKQVDVWSLGVILFYMLSKTLPFTGPDRIAISRKILKGEILWDAKSWRGVSMTSRDLVRQMLTVDPNARISIERILDHKWIAEDVAMQYNVNQLLSTSGQSVSSDEEPVPKRARLI